MPTHKFQKRRKTIKKRTKKNKNKNKKSAFEMKKGVINKYNETVKLKRNFNN